ncbi:MULTISPECIES: hypothetical protein [unclassified Pseudomonas]|uniref:hypothetical protein n=1 Tax=unclassified Pseudomonas TaxID=196821 RepID=UPI002449F06E|nr:MULTISPECIES: hypothetical protein [unclassified Pseudomonas]MDH0894657.1 hypothetical protein [Pseudomonas sp. GD03875]MDH1067293.1 hypothetical protein [Pseudomonas sp. GD03985]
MHAEKTTPITINVRQNSFTYIAKAKGFKPSASCTAGARQAAEALARKLGLAPGVLQEQQDADLAYGCSRFVHPGEQQQSAGGES